MCGTSYWCYRVCTEFFVKCHTVILSSTRLLSWLLAVVATVFLFWLSSTFGAFWWNPEVDTSNYWHLSDAFLHGQLSFLVEPSAELLALEDPYSLGERGTMPFIWDTSLYNGRYYLYFGPIPALLFYIPHKMLFGFYPDDDFAIATFSILTSVLLFVACRLVSTRLTQVRAPSLGAFWFLYIAFATSLSLQLGGAMYVVAATSAMFFQVLALISLLMVMTTTKSKAGWAAVMGVATICAIGSRPTHLVLVPVVLLALVLMGLRGSGRRASMRSCMAFMTPVALGGVALAAYNYLRFEDFTEFGLSYQLGVADLRKYALCSIQGVWEQPKLLAVQAWYLLLQYPTLLSEYPYLSFLRIAPEQLPVSIEGYLGADPVTGLFAFSPLLAPGLLATAVYWRRLTGPTRLVFGACLLIGAIGLVYLHTCFFAAARYLFEVVSALMIVTLPMLWVACSQARSLVGRWIWRCITVVGLVIGIAMGALGTLDGHFQKVSYTAPVLQAGEMMVRERLGLVPEPIIRYQDPSEQIIQ